MPPNTFMAIQLGIGASAVGEVGGNATFVPVPGPPQPRKTPDQLRVVVAGEWARQDHSPEQHFSVSQRRRKPDGPSRHRGPGHRQRHFRQWQDAQDRRTRVYYTTEGGQEYKFFLVDTPGYGDHVNASQSFQPVVDCIENGNKRYLAKVKNGNHTTEDVRVTAFSHR